jgi:hypothetical protein
MVRNTPPRLMGCLPAVFKSDFQKTGVTLDNTSCSGVLDRRSRHLMTPSLARRRSRVS